MTVANKTNIMNKNTITLEHHSQNEIVRTAGKVHHQPAWRAMILGLAATLSVAAAEETIPAVPRTDTPAQATARTAEAKETKTEGVASSVVLPSLDLDGVTLAEAVKIVNDKVKAAAPGKKVPVLELSENANGTTVIKDLFLKKVTFLVVAKYISNLASEPLAVKEDNLVLGK